MVEKGEGGISRANEQKEASSQQRIVSANFFEIEEGCRLYIAQKTSENTVTQQGDGTFWCRMVIVHVSHMVNGMDAQLVADLQADKRSLIVLGYGVDDSQQLDSGYLICIDLHLNWLSKQVTPGHVPRDSLLEELLGGTRVLHVDRQPAISQADALNLAEHLRKGEEAAKYFLLKYYFYKVMVHAMNRLLLSRSNLPRSDDMDFPTEEKKMSKALTMMDQSLQQKFPGVSELAFICGMSVTSFLEKFQAVYNQTPFEYFKKKQMQLAVTLLKRGYSVKSISHNLGYQDPANFSRAFKNFYGMSPKQYQR